MKSQRAESNILAHDPKTKPRTVISKEQQIVVTHAILIRAVVEACRDPALAVKLKEGLPNLRDKGWGTLAQIIARILNGEREQRILAGLDEEDAAITRAILLGLHSPETLPSPELPAADATLAAPAIAGLIHDAARGDAASYAALGQMASQMNMMGGDMAQVGALFYRLVNRERDADKLAKHLGARSQSLVLAILDELGRMERH